jgi:hypothetical protein
MEQIKLTTKPSLTIKLEQALGIKDTLAIQIVDKYWKDDWLNRPESLILAELIIKSVFDKKFTKV